MKEATQRLTVAFQVADLKHGYRRLKKGAVTHISRPDKGRTACGHKWDLPAEVDHYQFIAEWLEVTVRCLKCRDWWFGVGRELYEWDDKEGGYFPVSPTSKHGVK
jgi:hypothetical protein